MCRSSDEVAAFVPGPIKTHVKRGVERGHCSDGFSRSHLPRIWRSHPKKLAYRSVDAPGCSGKKRGFGLRPGRAMLERDWKWSLGRDYPNCCKQRSSAQQNEKRNESDRGPESFPSPPRGVVKDLTVSHVEELTWRWFELSMILLHETRIRPAIADRSDRVQRVRLEE